MSGEGREAPLPEAGFTLLVAQFGAQARIELGELPNPVTGKTEVSLKRAKFTIDLLQVMRDKTEGNLTPEETSLLDGMLYELRMSYVARQGDES